MKRILAVIFIILFSIFLYGKFIEVNNFKIKEYTIFNSNIPDTYKDLKIVHFSDILYEKNKDEAKLDKIVKEINNLDPDIIIFSGDLLKDDQKYTLDDYDFLKKKLTDLNANLYKFSVIGDNDELFIDEYKDIMDNSDFVLLNNENFLLFYKDITPINIVGINSLDNIEDLLSSDIAYNYSLFISHQPDYFPTLSNYNVNTILSGQSLGGVINIPFYGGIIKKRGAKTYINDYYKNGNTEIFISNGIGYENFDFRLFNTPSINVYRFDN